jgi:hypothetical protein
VNLNSDWTMVETTNYRGDGNNLSTMEEVISRLQKENTPSLILLAKVAYNHPPSCWGVVEMLRLQVGMEIH